MAKHNELPDFEAMAQAVVKDALRIAGVTGLNFFKDTFVKQGFTDKSFEPWTPRKNDMAKGRGVLTNTSYLANSLRILNKTKGSIVFGTDADYAQIHNEGGTFKVKVTKRSRKFFWYMHIKTGDVKWKRMALTKKPLTINIPKRQFIGESQTLMNKLDKQLLALIQKRFK